MTEPTQPEPVDSGEERVGSAVAAIRKRRQEIIGKGHIDLLVPGYEGNLKVRYRDLNDKEHDQLAKQFERAKHRDDMEGEREAIANLLIAHCDRIFVREPGTDEFMVLEENGDPLKFERRLAALLGLSADRAREVVLDVFSPRKDENRRCQPDAIAPHMEAIFAWRQGREDEINQALLGE